MFGNPYAERMALESTYEDTATITRAGYQKADDGFDKPNDGDVYTDIICALSKVSDTSAQTDAQQNIRRDMTLFVSPDKDIHAGDRVTVKRFGRLDGASTYDHHFEVVGVPVRYATHVEAALKDVDIA